MTAGNAYVMKNNIAPSHWPTKFALGAFQYRTRAMRLQKIHEINSIFPIRKYKAEDSCDRMIKNSIENWKRVALDQMYEKEYALPYLKRHKGGRLDKIVFERTAVAVAKWQQLSPIKVTKILRQIKKMPVMLAMGDLAQRGSNRYAVAIYKVIKSCLANAYRKYASDDPNAPPLLPRFKELSATSGGFIKRPLFRARGRCDIIRRPKAHIRVVLTV